MHRLPTSLAWPPLGVQSEEHRRGGWVNEDSGTTKQWKRSDDRTVPEVHQQKQSQVYTPDLHSWLTQLQVSTGKRICVSPSLV